MHSNSEDTHSVRGFVGTHISQSMTPKEYTSAALDSLPSLRSSGGMCVTCQTAASGQRVVIDHSQHRLGVLTMS